jgi:hypothetical protein
VTVALTTAELAMPDGIDWDPERRRLVLAPFGGTAIQSWRIGEPAQCWWALSSCAASAPWRSRRRT